MIFVVTGIHEHGFDRLVKAIDGLAERNVFDDVFVQTGYSRYVPKHCAWTKALDFYAFEEKLSHSTIVVTHGGAGCIAGALECDKPTVIVPRLQRYDEHNNDHQLELAAVLEKEGRALVAYAMEDLESKINEAFSFKPKPAQGTTTIVTIVRDFLKSVAGYSHG